MSIRKSVQAYRVGPTLGFKLEYHSPTAIDMDHFISSITYIRMQTGVLYYDFNDSSSFSQYLYQNFPVSHVSYMWDNMSMEITFSGEEKRKVGYKIEVYEMGTAYTIDIKPIWYILYGEPKWYEFNKKYGQKIYL